MPVCLDVVVCGCGCGCVRVGVGGCACVHACVCVMVTCHLHAWYHCMYWTALNLGFTALHDLQVQTVHNSITNNQL